MTHPLSQSSHFLAFNSTSIGSFYTILHQDIRSNRDFGARTLCSQKHTPPLKKWEVTISLEREDTIGTGGSSDQPKQISTLIHSDLSQSPLLFTSYQACSLLTSILSSVFSNCKSIPKESPYQQRCQLSSYSPLLILAFKLTFRIIFHPFSQKGRAVYLTK